MLCYFGYFLQLILELVLITFIHNGILRKDVSHMLTLIITLKRIAFKQQFTKLTKWAK